VHRRPLEVVAGGEGALAGAGENGDPVAFIRDVLVNPETGAPFEPGPAACVASPTRAAIDASVLPDVGT